MLDLKKVYISLLLSLVTIILSMPSIFSVTDTIFRKMNIRTTYDNCPGLPTVYGNIIHGCMFGIICYITLSIKDNTISKTIKIDKIRNAVTIKQNDNE
jgi:hypothetical protein